MADREAGVRAGERAIALAYAPAAIRPALTTLLALDDALGRVLRTTREPLVGQMRLAWWRDALMALGQRTPPAEPILVAVAGELLPRGASAVALAMMTEGWEMLLADPLDDAALAAFAAGRGGGLFRLAALLLSVPPEPAVIAGEGWALADLARNLTDPAVADRARAMAAERFDLAFMHRWPGRSRPLGALALLAHADLAGIAPGSPRRLWRLLRHRLTGL